MNDPVDRLIDERERMDHGLSGGFLLSIAAHVLLVGIVLVAPLLHSSEPPLRVQEGFAVPMPPGGGGVPAPAPPPGESPASAPGTVPDAPAPLLLLQA